MTIRAKNPDTIKQEKLDGLRDLEPGQTRRYQADARSLPLASESVDLIVTSPPYWRKRDYRFKNQIGQERTAEEFVFALTEALSEWSRVLRPTGSVFLNIGDTYTGRSLAGVPAMLETAARQQGWLIRNRIIWTKPGGMPSPAKNRLTNRHEYVLHLTKGTDYFYDLQAYTEYSGREGNPGDVWQIRLGRHMGDHLAPFPHELVERAIVLACPLEVCSKCGEPRRRVVRRTRLLDPSRPQARRAMAIAHEFGLSDEHIAAIQATGVSDAGKALRTQNGTGKNSARVRQLAGEAKKVLGGYFREFTFARWETVAWTSCDCKSPFHPGIVLDPFVGTGTTMQVAASLGLAGVGTDLMSEREAATAGNNEQFALPIFPRGAGTHSTNGNGDASVLSET